MEWNDRVEKKLDFIVTDVNSMKITLAAQHISLEDHIKRTNLLEEELKPIKKHVYHVEGALKLLGAMSLFAGIIETLVLVFRR